MQKSKASTLQLAGTFALAMLVGSSSFAEARHLGGTRGGEFSHPSFGRGIVSRPHVSHGFGHAAPRIAPRAPSNYYGRSAPYRGGGSFYNNGSRFYGRGRIDRIAPYHGGYNVWLGNWGYPFYVPYRFYNPYRFRVGLFIGFNAFYDPLGYYSVYGAPYYGGYYPSAYSEPRYRDDNYDSNDVVQGVVESIDLHSGTVIIIEERSNRRTTALLPPRDRRVDEIRVGDYIELSGSWVRGRNYEFDADRLDRFDARR